MTAAVTPEAGTAGAPEGAAPGMTRRQILQAMSGLMAGMFVAILASTVVSNALPRIISDLNGSQSAYTWVVTAELLAMTATVPIWGKLSDLYDKKLLIQLSLSMFVVGSLVMRLLAQRRAAHREPRRAGHRRGRSHRARPGRDGRDHPAA